MKIEIKLELSQIVLKILRRLYEFTQVIFTVILKIFAYIISKINLF
jgi:hypothetical protein